MAIGQVDMLDELHQLLAFEVFTPFPYRFAQLFLNFVVLAQAQRVGAAFDGVFYFWMNWSVGRSGLVPSVALPCSWLSMRSNSSAKAI